MLIENKNYIFDKLFPPLPLKYICMWNVLTRILKSNLLLADIKAIISFSTGNVGVKVVHTGRET